MREIVAFKAGRYHRISYHELEKVQKQLGVKFYEYEEWMTFDRYLNILKMFKNLGTDYWYASQLSDSASDRRYKCRFGFVNQKDALAFKLMLE